MTLRVDFGDFLCMYEYKPGRRFDVTLVSITITMYFAERDTYRKEVWLLVYFRGWGYCAVMYC